MTKKEMKKDQKSRMCHTSLGADGETNFVSLPGELRNNIYRLALVETITIRIRFRAQDRPHPYRSLLFGAWSGSTNAWREPGLLRASKSIRIEASSIYIGLNSFGVHVYPHDIKQTADWLQTVVTRCGNSPFGGFHFFVTALKFHWEDLYSMLPLVNVFATTGLILSPGKHTLQHGTKKQVRKRRQIDEDEDGDHDGTEDAFPDSHIQDSAVSMPLFVMSYNRNDHLGDALQEAVDMGIQAHKEGWHLDLMEFKFDEWFDNNIETYIERGRKRNAGNAGGGRRRPRKYPPE